MSKLNTLAWIDTCCADLLQWCEVQTHSGQWLRIKKRRVGGYLVTRFTADQRQQLADEIELSGEQVEVELNS